MNEGPVSTGELRITHRGKLIERLVGSGHQVQRGHVRPCASHDVLVIARSDLLSTCEKCLSEPRRQGLTFLAEFSGRRGRAIDAGQHEARFNRLWPVAGAPQKKTARIPRSFVLIEVFVFQPASDDDRPVNQIPHTW